jgi:GAF domain-containing protein
MKSALAELEMRLRVLARYDILDTPPEQEFDDLAFLAGFICGTPMALITLLDAQRQWFKSRIGIDVSETPIDHSFCMVAASQHELLIIPDAARDERFAHNPMVAGEPGIRFYAGAPLVTDDGVALGSICVIDQTPRTLSEDQQAALFALARQVINQLESRRLSRDLAAALVEKEELLRKLGERGH